MAPRPRPLSIGLSLPLAEWPQYPSTAKILSPHTAGPLTAALVTETEERARVADRCALSVSMHAHHVRRASGQVRRVSAKVLPPTQARRVSVALPELEEDREGQDAYPAAGCDHSEESTDHSHGRPSPRHYGHLERSSISRCGADQYPERPRALRVDGNIDLPDVENSPTADAVDTPERFRGLLSPIEPAVTPTSARAYDGFYPQATEHQDTCVRDDAGVDGDSATDNADRLAAAYRGKGDNRAVEGLEERLGGVLIKETRGYIVS
ncbi:uncharacterized protein EHS24_001626 [Apiotrichum porosum]|uniref:Uncharacterized protein n=1 Tax=Apiotrichum porosum TaxID=105984 RepID=A0A427XJ14_9TREE|nr:uncharacterized protein EHS24_001626 [Apiotrichum porosum]RSH78727.1 hypothetical protein EHS24_001626 [Apiotrichum porosum]